MTNMHNKENEAKINFFNCNRDGVIKDAHKARPKKFYGIIPKAFCTCILFFGTIKPV